MCLIGLIGPDRCQSLATKLQSILGQHLQHDGFCTDIDGFADVTRLNTIAALAVGQVEGIAGGLYPIGCCVMTKEVGAWLKENVLNSMPALPTQRDFSMDLR